MMGLPRIAILGALPLLFLRGYATTAANWRDAMAEAERLAHEGKAVESATAAQAALADAEIRLGPENPETVHILARLSQFYEAAGAAARFPEMEKRLSEIKSKNFEVWFALGVSLHVEGKAGEAESALRKAVAAKPDYFDAAFELAQVYDDMGRYAEEAPLLRDLIEKKPQGYSLYSQLARVYLALGRPVQAKATYARARKINGQAAAAYLEEGYFELDSGESVHAEEDFERAIAVDTTSPFGYHHMGAYLAESGQYPEAEKYFRWALGKLESDRNANVDDIAHTMTWLGRVLTKQKRYAEAEVFFLKILEKAKPGGVRQLAAYHWLGVSYVSQGKTAQAEETFKLAVDACAARYSCNELYASRALIDLGQSYLSQGRRAEAEAMAGRVEKLWENILTGKGLLDGLKQLSEFYEKLGDVSKKEALYVRLLPLRRRMPFNIKLVWVEEGLANMDVDRGRFAEAEDFYRQEAGILDRNQRWKEEADALDAVARTCDREEKPREAAAARKRSEALRARP